MSMSGSGGDEEGGVQAGVQGTTSWFRSMTSARAPNVHVSTQGTNTDVDA